MKGINRLASFIKADHRYVYLGTSAIAALGLAFSQRNPTPLSFLAPTGVFQDCLWVILWAWLVVSAAALVTKLIHWNDYRETSPFASERCRRGARLGSYVVVAIAAIFFIDRCVMSFVDLVQVSIVSDSNPSDFLSSLVYMTYKSGDFFIRGIEITIALATFGTVIAFFLALLFVFLRTQTFDRVDNDLVRFFKSIGRGFATIYSTVVRGTPMMVQGLLIYYAGFTVLRGMGFETAQANQIWSTFTAGLVTISLNSTAYMMEVLRGGIESIDPGQAEAARSLGLSQWQAMRKVVFPQGIKKRDPGAHQRAHHQHQGLVGALGHRRVRPHVRHHHRRRRVLPPDGGLLRGARGLSDPDARGEPPARGLWQKARRRGSGHAAQL